MAAKKKPDDDEDDTGDGSFSEAQLAQLNDLITSKANATVSALLQRKLDGAVKSQLEGPLAEFRTLLEGFRPGGAPTGGEGKKPEGGGDHPEIAQLKARDAEREKRLKAMEDERVAERRRSLNSDRDNKLRDIATTAGVDKNRVRGVVALLGSSVNVDEKTGAMTVKVQREGYEDEQTVDAYAADFFKSDEGKAYLAPTQPARPGGPQRTTAAGVVARPAGGGMSNAPDRGAKAAKSEKIAEAHEALTNAIGELVGGGSVGIG